MEPNNRKIYWILALLSLAGYSWVGYHVLMHDHATVTVCMFKNITGVPCPSCGITRSVLSLLQGDLYHAVMINPLGILAALLLIIVPLWMLTDAITSRVTLVRNFRRAEHMIRTQKIIYIPLLLLMAINWGWNIIKDI
ncbi:MAG TPA: DUF2752 domain-containing protein [Ohtaekwangia sp.]|uniref:DUF2752 domain-containing protein n=1 Tax=Ohtaekwangia sp. TaxID=2066019 RepID=UPI002F938911